MMQKSGRGIFQEKQIGKFQQCYNYSKHVLILQVLLYVRSYRKAEKLIVCQKVRCCSTQSVLWQVTAMPFTACLCTVRFQHSATEGNFSFILRHV